MLLWSPAKPDGSFCESALAEPSEGSIFAATVFALEEKRLDRLEKLYALAAATPESRAGFVGALRWVERDCLRGVGAALLGSEEPRKRFVGIATCSSHRIDPGLVSGGWLADADPSVRGAFSAPGW